MPKTNLGNETAVGAIFRNISSTSFMAKEPAFYLISPEFQQETSGANISSRSYKVLKTARCWRLALKLSRIRP